MKRGVGSYSEDNAETARREGDDVGLPENPVYSNFSAHLWKACTGRREIQSPNRLRGNTGMPQPPPNEPLLARLDSRPAVEKNTRHQAAA